MSVAVLPSIALLIVENPGWLMLIVCRILPVCTVHSYLIGIVIISLFPMLCLLIILLPVWLFIITLFPMRAGGFACSIDASWKIKISKHPLQIDYLYISKGYNGRIEELTSLFRIRTVVLDVSLSDYRSDILKN